jgi:hypothetical protein
MGVIFAPKPSSFSHTKEYRNAVDINHHSLCRESLKHGILRMRAVIIIRPLSLFRRKINNNKLISPSCYLCVCICKNR